MSAGPGMLGAIDHPALDPMRAIVPLRDQARIRPGLTRRSVLGSGGLSQASTLAGNDPLGIRRVDRGVGAAVKHDHASALLPTRAAVPRGRLLDPHLPTHRREGRHDVIGGAIGQARVDADRPVELRIGLAHDRRHRAAGGETGDEDPVLRDGVLVAEALGQAGDDRRLAGVAHLVARPEPVPAGHGIVAAGLRRIDDEQPVLFGQGVHPGPGGEVLRVLRAAVQHHDQSLQPFVGGGRNIEPVAARARCAGIALIEELGAVGQGQFRGVRRLAKTRQSFEPQPHSTRSQGADDLAQGFPHPIGPRRKVFGSVTGAWQSV